MAFSAGVLTVSDRSFSGERPDKSGPLLIEYLKNNGFDVTKYSVVPDELRVIEQSLIDMSDSLKVNLVITTGGTGVAPRDVTPEATLNVATKAVPGISEVIRITSLNKTSHAMLSRGVSVIRGTCLIINLPGSPKACIESMDAIIEALPHALGLLRGEKLDS